MLSATLKVKREVNLLIRFDLEYAISVHVQSPFINLSRSVFGFHVNVKQTNSSIWAARAQCKKVYSFLSLSKILFDLEYFSMKSHSHSENLSHCLILNQIAFCSCSESQKTTHRPLPHSQFIQTINAIGSFQFVIEQLIL